MPNVHVAQKTIGPLGFDDVAGFLRVGDAEADEGGFVALDAAVVAGGGAVTTGGALVLAWVGVATGSGLFATVRTLDSPPLRANSQMQPNSTTNPTRANATTRLLAGPTRSTPGTTAAGC
jgi:hypothetical protein